MHVRALLPSTLIRVACKDLKGCRYNWLLHPQARQVIHKWRAADLSPWPWGCAGSGRGATEVPLSLSLEEMQRGGLKQVTVARDLADGVSGGLLTVNEAVSVRLTPGIREGTRWRCQAPLLHSRIHPIRFAAHGSYWCGPLL